ncbi:MAG: DUF222 domain-containing protein [bacterium]|nr:DUF222 domain-containing protein [bacterium]
MDNEHLFATLAAAESDTSDSTGRSHSPDPAVDDRIAALLEDLDRIQVGPMPRHRADRALDLLGRFQTRVASMMCDISRSVSESDANSDPAEVLRTKARLPRRDSKRLAKVARHLEDMPKAKEKFANGEITVDQANALANAAEKVGPEAVDADDSLLESADRMLSDKFGRHAKEWADRKLIERGMNPLQRQRQAREAKLWVEDRTGLGVLMAKLPAPQYQHLRQAVDHRYMELLRRDGADSQDADKVRSPQHRLADAVFELLCNRDAETGEFIEGNPGVKAKAATQLVLVAPMGVIDGADPAGHVDMIGVGPVPPDILATLTPDTELAGMVFDRTGRPLWLGRNQRLGNAAQRLAIAVRDGGCFECVAPMHRCELHHIQEWHRDGGRTDVDNLVAVCRRHHKRLETQDLQVIRTADGYQTRPRDGPAP